MTKQTTVTQRGPKLKTHTRDNQIRDRVQMLHETGYAATGIKEVVGAVEVQRRVNI